MKEDRDRFVMLGTSLFSSASGAGPVVRSWQAAIISLILSVRSRLLTMDSLYES